MSKAMNPAIYTAFATITAAFIAGLVAFLSSMLSKEQKISEFRYSWLNAVLDDTAAFLGAAQSLSTLVGNSTEAGSGSLGPESDQHQLNDALAAYYRARIRLYPQEHASAIAALDELHALLLIPGPVERTSVDSSAGKVVQATHQALKEEWGRVKQGEKVFRRTKSIGLVVIVLSAIGMAVAVYIVSR